MLYILYDVISVKTNIFLGNVQVTLILTNYHLQTNLPRLRLSELQLESVIMTMFLLLYNTLYQFFVFFIFFCWQWELNSPITHPVPTYISTVPAATLPFEIPALAVKVGFEPTSALVTIYLYIPNFNPILIEIVRLITPYIVFKQFRTCFRKISFTNGWTRTNTALPIAYHIRLMIFQQRTTTPLWEHCT